MESWDSIEAKEEYARTNLISNVLVGAMLVLVLVLPSIGAVMATETENGKASREPGLPLKERFMQSLRNLQSQRTTAARRFLAGQKPQW